MLTKVKSTQLEEHCIATILRLNGSFLKKDLGPCSNEFGSYLDCKTKSVLRGFSPFSPLFQTRRLFLFALVLDPKIHAVS